MLYLLVAAVICRSGPRSVHFTCLRHQASHLCLSMANLSLSRASKRAKTQQPPMLNPLAMMMGPMAGMMNPLAMMNRMPDGNHINLAPIHSLVEAEKRKKRIQSHFNID